MKLLGRMLVMGDSLSSDPTRESHSDFSLSRLGKTTFCLIVVPWPHGELNLSGYLTDCSQRLNFFEVYKSGKVYG